MRIFALCGSPRPQSFNRAILEAVRPLLANGDTLDICESLTALPHFIPDRDDLRAHLEVHRMTESVRTADVLLIACPEYVHGVPGTLKNALDWLVGSGVCDQKLCAVVNVTPSPNEPAWVRDGLIETLNVMTAQKVVKEASFTVTAAARKFDASLKIKDPALTEQLKRSLAMLKELSQKSSAEGALNDQLPCS